MRWQWPTNRRRRPYAHAPSDWSRHRIGPSRTESAHPGDARYRSAPFVEQLRVAAQVKGPALIALHSVSNRLPAGAVAVQVAVLQFDDGAVRALGDEADLNLAGLVGIGFDLPGSTDVPADHHPVGRFVGEDARPAALTAVDSAVV